MVTYNRHDSATVKFAIATGRLEDRSNERDEESEEEVLQRERREGGVNCKDGNPRPRVLALTIHQALIDSAVA